MSNETITSSKHFPDVDTSTRYLESRRGTTNNIDQSIFEHAHALSQNTQKSIRGIIDELVESSFKKHRTLKEDFIKRFRRLKIAEKLINTFIEQLKLKELKYTKASKFEAALLKSEIWKCLNGYAQDTNRTMDRLVESNKAELAAGGYNVRFWDLFDSDIKKAWAEEIYKATAHLAEEKFQSMFNSNPRNFICDYFFARAINTDHHDINRPELMELLQFIDGQKFPLEDLYEMLYNAIIGMKEAQANNPASIILAYRSKVGRVMGAERKKEGRKGSLVPPRQDAFYLQPGFDFNDFFNHHIKPLIREIRKNKLPDRANLRSIDFTDTSPEGISQTIFPEEVPATLSNKVSLIDECEENYQEELRRYFNYAGYPGNRISDARMEKELGKHLDQVKEQIEYTIYKGLRRRSPEDPIRSECRFMDEILNCRKVKDLLRWMVDPQDFINRHPAHKNTKKRIISHQCRVMLSLLLFYRKNVFSEKFKHLDKNRDELEYHLLSVLLPIEDKDRHRMSDPKFLKAMKEKYSTNGEIEFRIGEEIDSRTGKTKIQLLPDGRKVPVYKVFQNSEAVRAEGNSYDFEGKKYKLHPVEKEKFQSVRVAIPVRRNGKIEKHHTVIYVYSGDGNLIHCKKPIAYLSSLLRGKEPTDLLRWAIATRNDEDADALRDFLYNSYGDFETIKDAVDKRYYQRKRSKKERTDGSSILTGNRKFQSSMYATLAEVPPEYDENGNNVTVAEKSIEGGNQITYKHVAFETQIYNMESILIYFLSDYTVSSHDNVYTPEREFTNLFKYLFPPTIYGSHYADLHNQGYANGQKIPE